MVYFGFEWWVLFSLWFDFNLGLLFAFCRLVVWVYLILSCCCLNAFAFVCLLMSIWLLLARLGVWFVLVGFGLRGCL